MRLILMLPLLLSSGCGLIGQSALQSAVGVVEDKVNEKLKEALEDKPASCEFENHPDEEKALFLCTVCYGELEEGEQCE